MHPYDLFKHFSSQTGSVAEANYLHTWPQNCCQLSNGNNHLLGSLSEQLHATCNPFIDFNSPPHGQYLPQTKLPNSSSHLPKWLPCHSIKQSRNYTWKRHSTQHQPYPSHGLNMPKHKTKAPYAPIMQAMPSHIGPTCWSWSAQP